MVESILVSKISKMKGRKVCGGGVAVIPASSVCRFFGDRFRLGSESNGCDRMDVIEWM